MLTSASRWHGLEAVRMQDAALVVDVLPQLGAKVASLRFRGRELLVQPSPGFEPSGSQDYLDSGLCGWDEMFPTIVGHGLPDHGELWSRPWQVSSTQDAVRTWVTCTTVPVEFVRTLRLRGPELVADYEVRNLSAEPVEALWAAHPQLLLDDSSRLSSDATTWVQVSGAAEVADPVVLPLVEAVRAGGTAKWWSGRDDRPRWVRLIDRHVAVTVSWHGGVVRHVGVWVDMAALAGSPAVSLQPSTSWHDDLHLARTNGSQLVVPASGTVSWQTRLQVRSGYPPVGPASSG